MNIKKSLKGEWCGLTEIYTVKAFGVLRRYKCGSAAVAAKRFLNYLRRYSEERPTHLEIKNESGREFEARVSWYFGKLENSSFEGAEGTWYKLEEVKRK